MIDNSFLHNLINNPSIISNLDFDLISKILNRVKSIFENEHLLLELTLNEKDKEIYVIGDIHGNLETLMKLIETIDEKKPSFVIFLGDIVDRGPKQLECLLLVLSLKILYPKKYFILKGNHETLEMNQYYGFFQEFNQKFNKQIKFDEILMIYNILPICAVINSVIVCLHGGIPQDIEFLKKLKDKKTRDFKTFSNSIAQGIFQIMWNDPKSEIRGFIESFRGSGVKFFGEDVFNEFMEANNLKHLIRAHEWFSEGFKWFFKRRLLSIFSSANYRGSFSPNPASYALIKNNKIIPKLVKLS